MFCLLIGLTLLERFLTEEMRTGQWIIEDDV